MESSNEFMRIGVRWVEHFAVQSAARWESFGDFGSTASKFFHAVSNSGEGVASKHANRKNNTMKKLIPILTIALVALFAAPSAEARGYHSRRYVDHHRSCGGPAWIETYVAYYDHCGRPVLRTRVVAAHRHYRATRPVYRPAPVCRPVVRYGYR
jgi:hypothetical protein